MYVYVPVFYTHLYVCLNEKKILHRLSRLVRKRQRFPNAISTANYASYASFYYLTLVVFRAFFIPRCVIKLALYRAPNYAPP